MLQTDKKIKIIFLVGFLFAFHLAITAYINSSFLSTFLAEKKIGLIYALASASAIFALLLVPKILKKLGGYKFLLIISILNLLSLFSLSVTNNTLGIIVLFIFYFTLNNLIIFILDELLQIFSKGSIVGRIRGLYLTIINSAWVFAQIFSGKVLSGLSFSFFYLMASGVMFLFLLIVLISFKNTPDPNYDKLPIFKSIRKFFKNKTLARSYRINFLLQFFYSWMVIYTPLYLFTHLGFTWKEISIIFTIMLLPFVLIQFPLGQHSDKVGERKIMMIGFFIISLTTMSLFFITKHSVWIWALALFGTRLGAASVEVMSDAYFFKHINKENDEFIGVYRNTGPMAYILAPLLASGLFFIIPDLNFIFLILGALMLSGVYTASTIQKDDI
ncbi:hypothetical protein COU49_02095 [Candidatus Nomurabacteria bacterium CG10_big_fil_rev_8_21_14_0_10_35_16]|uniref:Major facilitator superfamily (MFS) profile domain-containing protein n=1 Tax=Candidatus Nomurabacteria bacterium CG10_big_fil_rev_8_21_14_0_10_35_16 TaxID=1974731 RepID=A0A2H0TB61_9BACT|nr:MAG: hypothetical protein COU49_02095 [Candidatus Nomurabacteria bacterium CG10_big_fil_rev_8_21_14_0_10_35_16]